MEGVREGLTFTLWRLGRIRDTEIIYGSIGVRKNTPKTQPLQIYTFNATSAHRCMYLSLRPELAMQTPVMVHNILVQARHKRDDGDNDVSLYILVPLSLLAVPLQPLYALSCSGK